MDARVRVLIHGRVQGVRFRFTTAARAQGLGLTGWVRNLSDGSVESLFEGSQETLEEKLQWYHPGPRTAKVKNEESLININALLSKADICRRIEVNNKRKWDSVLANLENSFDEIKARREAGLVEFKQTKRKLNDLEKEKIPKSRREAPTERQQQDANASGVAISDSSKSAAKQILSMSLDELSKLSLEEVTLLHQQVGIEFSNELLIEDSKVSGQMELTNQSSGTSQTLEESNPGRRRPILLRAAIEKILSNNIKNLTEEEVQVTLICHALLRRRVNPSIRDERLIRVLGGFVKMVCKDHDAEKSLPGNNAQSRWTHRAGRILASFRSLRTMKPQEKFSVFLPTVALFMTRSRRCLFQLHQIAHPAGHGARFFI